MTIGNRIKERRLKLGLTVEELASKLGKNRATVYRYENGDIENLPIHVLEPLAIVLNTTPAYLIGWTNNAEHSTESDQDIIDTFANKLDIEWEMTYEDNGKKVSSKSHSDKAVVRKILEKTDVKNKKIKDVIEVDTKSEKITVELSPLETEHIEKYRTLDEHGTEMVDMVLDKEYDRCIAIEEKEPTIEMNYSFLPASAGSGEFLSEENMELREYPDTPESRQADVVIPVDGDSMEPIFSDGDELYVRLQPDIEIGEIGIFTQGGKGYVKKKGRDRLISLNPDYPDIYPNEYEEIRCVGKVIGKV